MYIIRNVDLYIVIYRKEDDQKLINGCHRNIFDKTEMFRYQTWNVEKQI